MPVDPGYRSGDEMTGRRPPPIRVCATFVVSCDGWVARTTTRREGLGIAIRHPLGTFVVASGPVFAPDLEALTSEVEAAGGPPAATSKVTLTKVELTTPDTDESVTLRMPDVSCDDRADLAWCRLIADTPASRFVTERAGAIDAAEAASIPLHIGQRLAARSVFVSDSSLWSVDAPVYVASDPDVMFGNVCGAVALAGESDPALSGAVVWNGARPQGIVVSLSESQLAMIRLGAVLASLGRTPRTNHPGAVRGAGSSSALRVTP